MRASSITGSVVTVCTVAAMLLLGIPAANAADGVPDPTTTQPVVTADTSPSPDSVPATPPAAETANSDAPAAIVTDVPATLQARTTPVVQTMSTDKQNTKVTICHRTDSATNPYRQITVDQSAVDGVGNSDHYGEHQGPLASTTVVAQQLKDAHIKWGDIIPPLKGVHNGLNWTTEGQAIYDANCVVPTPPLTPKVCSAITAGPVATNLDEAGWNHHDTRSTGKVDYVSGGVRLHTTDSANPSSSQNKVTVYRDITPTPLAQFGEPSVTFASGGTGVKPSMQVGVDVDGNGTWDGYLVGEPDSYGAHNWWVNKPGFNVPSGMGYTSFGSWANFVAANPNAKVIELGLSLGSGVLGDWTVTNLTAGCTSYTFNYVAPPVVVAPSATIDSVCAADGTDVTAHLVAGTNNNTFQILINGVKVGEQSVQAGETFDWKTTLAEDSSGGSATVEVKSGEVSLTSVITVSTDCLPPVTIIPTPPAPKVTAPTCTADGSLPTLMGGTGYTAVYNRPFNGPGVYTAIYTITGNNTAFTNGKTVSYDLTVGKKLTENCATTTGGANTGMFGNQPGAASVSASNPMNSFMGIGGIALAIAALIGLSIVVRPKRSHAGGTVGVE